MKIRVSFTSVLLMVVVCKTVFLLAMQAWGRAPSCCRLLPCWAQTHRLVL